MKKIADLQVASGPAKEQIKGRVLFPREGRAGSTEKFECWLVDESGVLVVEAWGSQNIAEAKKQFQDGKVGLVLPEVVLEGLRK